MLHSCLTALGDLGRYYEMRKPREQRKDWRHSKACYRLALRFSCTAGKVHNVLGVVATHEKGRELVAAYSYARALIASTPFPAKDNLRSVLRKVAERTGGRQFVGVDGSAFKSSEYFRST